MDVLSNIKKRKSWRTYKKEPLSDEIIHKIKQDLVKIHIGPLKNQVHVYFFSKETTEDQKLGTYGMIKNAHYFLGGEIIPEKEAFLDFGYVLEKAVLCLTDLDLGTCWLGGTFKRSKFMDAADIDENKIMPAVIATGYPKSKKSLWDKLVSLNAGSQKRKPWKELFFDENLNPLDKDALGDYGDLLEMVRIAPSASNLQPWRIIKHNDRYHFYLKRKKLYQKIIKNVDLQMIDMGIAKYHFAGSASQLGLGGDWQIEESEIDKNWEYVISWIAE